MFGLIGDHGSLFLVMTAQGAITHFSVVGHLPTKGPSALKHSSYHGPSTVDRDQLVT